MHDAHVADNMRKLEDALRLLPHGYNGYENKDRVRRDVQELLKSCRSLIPQTGTFAGQGQSATLFYLYGTLPINYRGAVYNIPVTIYLDPPYPMRPPRCFVTPTDSMSVSKDHPNVDMGGMVYLPYLSSWRAQSSSLVELVAMMSSVFCEKPPVYATAKSSQPQQAQGSGLVGAVGGAISSLFGQQAPASHQPSGGYAQPVQPARPVQPVQPVATPAYAQPVAAVTARPVVAAHVTATPANPKANLVRETEQLLKERWRSVVEPLVDGANAQIDRRRELREHTRKVDEQLAALEAEESRCLAQAGSLEAARPALEAFLAENEGREANPEHIRDQLDADSRQVLDLVAEELALEELLVALDDLLANRKINLEDFMRDIRDASRKRFMCQALRKKSEAALQAARSPSTSPLAPHGTPAANGVVGQPGARVAVAVAA